MARRPCVIDMARLAELAEAGYLYQSWFFITASAVVPALGVFCSGNSKGLDVHLLSIRAVTTIQGTFNVQTLAADPAVAGHSTGTNLRLGQQNASQAFVEYAAAAAAAGQFLLMGTPVLAFVLTELLTPTSIFMPPNTQLQVTSSVAVQTVDYAFLWAEIPQEYEFYDAVE